MVESSSCQRDCQESSPTPLVKGINSSALSFLYSPWLYMTTSETISLTRWIFVGKVMSLIFNMLSRLVISFIPRSKHLLISWLQSPIAVTLEPPKIKFPFFPIYLPWSEETRCHDLSFLNVVLSQFFHFPVSLSLRGSLVPLDFCISRVTIYTLNVLLSWFGTSLLFHVRF